MSYDFVSLVLQAARGAITATAPTGDKATTDMGVNVMIASFGMQVASLTVFMALCADFWNRVRKSPERVECGDREPVALKRGAKWKAFLVGKTKSLFSFSPQSPHLLFYEDDAMLIRYSYCHHYYCHFYPLHFPCC